MATKTTTATVDDYLAALSDDKRVALEQLRRTIRASGTIRFPADRPSPASPVRKLVRTRIAENAG